MRRGGFSLIELMAAVGIMLLLVSLILIALNVSRQRARMVGVRRDIEQIELAWGAYLADYHVFPFTGSGSTLTVDSDQRMLVLRGGRTSDYTTPEAQAFRALNPKGIRYYDIHVLSQGVRDPWGNFYQIAFDINNTGTVDVPGPNGLQSVRKSVAVWSMGPDGASGGDFSRDDITSWRVAP
jgi:prepilin-type N-terminal cleavage/methylation domain-containing protein